MENKGLAIQLLHSALCALGQHEWATHIPSIDPLNPDNSMRPGQSVCIALLRCKYCHTPYIDNEAAPQQQKEQKCKPS